MAKMQEESVQPTHDFFASIVSSLVKKKDGSALLEVLSSSSFFSLLSSFLFFLSFLFRSFLFLSLHSLLFPTQIMDLMDKHGIAYGVGTFSPLLFHFTSSHDYPTAWQVMTRGLMQRFDLKSLPLSQKRALKMLGFMHPVENGVFLD